MSEQENNLATSGRRRGDRVPRRYNLEVVLPFGGFLATTLILLIVRSHRAGSIDVFLGVLLLGGALGSIFVITRTTAAKRVERARISFLNENPGSIVRIIQRDSSINKATIGFSPGTTPQNSGRWDDFSLMQIIDGKLRIFRIGDNANLVYELDRTAFRSVYRIKLAIREHIVEAICLRWEHDGHRGRLNLAIMGDVRSGLGFLPPYREDMDTVENELLQASAEKS